jgi:hypothetical protein
MIARAVILLASLAANIVLGNIFLRHETVLLHFNKPKSVANVATSAAIHPVNVVQPQTVPVQETNSPFSWAQLESEDFKEYIARMRAFGVPEKTIRDIIITEIRKLYAPRLAALRPKQAANPKYWERNNFRPYGYMTKDQRDQIKALQKEEHDLVRSLLGENVYAEMAKDSGAQDYLERELGPLSGEQKKQVNDIIQKFQEARSDIYAKANGYIDMDTQADIKALDKKFRAELATVLTPQQVENYELQNSDIASNMRFQLGAFDPNEQEFRSIYDYKQAMDDLNSGDSEDLTAADRRMLQEKQKEFDATLAQSLGPERLKEYKLMDDYAFQNLSRAGVSMDTIKKIADMKLQVETAAQQIRSNSSLTRDQRNMALKEIRSTTQQSLAEVLGDRRAKAYVGNGGWWVRSIAPNN